MRDHYDVIVIGARPAGAATAWLLARAGARVLVIDRGQPGSDTLSTHALMRGAVLLLNRWGVLPRLIAANTPPIAASEFRYGAERVHVPIKPRDGISALYAPRRTVLDSALATMARDAGADVIYGATLKSLLRSRLGRVDGIVMSADGQRAAVTAEMVVGADGLRSTLAAEVAPTPYRVGRHASAVVYGHWHGIELNRYVWSYARNAAAGAIPTNDGATCVFASVASARFAATFRPDVTAGYRTVIGQADPLLAEALATATLLGPLKGFAGQPGMMRQSWGDGWALVGDAAHFKDPITAHGITDALRDADLLASAILRGGLPALAAYQEERDALSSGIFETSDAIAAFDWDLDTVATLHRRLSDAMADEVAAIRARVNAGAWSSSAPGPATPPARCAPPVAG